MKNKNQLAIILLEKLIDFDDLGRPLKPIGHFGVLDLKDYLFKKDKVVYDDSDKLIKDLHRDELINYDISTYDPNQSTVILLERGLEYYKAKTREFI